MTERLSTPDTPRPIQGPVNGRAAPLLRATRICLYGGLACLLVGAAVAWFTTDFSNSLSGIAIAVSGVAGLVLVILARFLNVVRKQVR